ncbi:Alginate biosynthesis protein AlgA [Planctomycetales bacterium 10988]|nr:Alginate biosynthesis protein AlgA [Planctomycetales bacterium 10988]
MLHAIIMAGGSGTRFWPESTKMEPKQLLQLAGDETMMQATVSRLEGLVPADNLLIVTGAHLVEPIAQQLPKIPRDAIVGEPCKRDTAPCIGLAALLVAKNDPDGVMAVMPADHVISPDEKFREILKQAGDCVLANPNTIVTFGIKPTYPAEIYGYIERGEAVTDSSAPEKTYKVEQFKEKPAVEDAEKYLEAGTFYWNSGIFVWKAELILKALSEHQPEMFAHLQKIADSYGTPAYAETLEKEFTAIKPISIDYAVMEHYKDVLVIEAPFSWDDVGSWRALSRLRGTDDNGNTIVGKHLGIRTEDCIVRGQKNHLITTLGMKNCIIVQTPNSTLVANKDDEEAIRELVKMIKEQGWEEHL